MLFRLKRRKTKDILKANALPNYYIKTIFNKSLKYISHKQIKINQNTTSL